MNNHEQHTPRFWIDIDGLVRDRLQQHESTWAEGQMVDDVWCKPDYGHRNQVLERLNAYDADQALIEQLVAALETAYNSNVAPGGHCFSCDGQGNGRMGTKHDGSCHMGIVQSALRQSKEAQP